MTPVHDHWDTSGRCFPLAFGTYTRRTGSGTQHEPPWLLDRLRPQEAADTHARGAADTVVPRHRVAAYVAAALRAEAEKVVAARPGSRNQTLFIAAARLGGFVTSGLLAEDVVRATLTTACTSHVGIGGFTEAEIARTVASGLRRGGQAPRGVPDSRRR
jgi:hypothetical protein